MNKIVFLDFRPLKSQPVKEESRSEKIERLKKLQKAIPEIEQHIKEVRSKYDEIDDPVELLITSIKNGIENGMLQEIKDQEKYLKFELFGELIE